MNHLSGQRSHAAEALLREIRAPCNRCAEIRTICRYGASTACEWEGVSQAKYKRRNFLILNKLRQLDQMRESEDLPELNTNRDSVVLKVTADARVVRRDRQRC